MQQKLTAITQRDMSRKEFLALIGLGAASILGFSNILRLLGGQSQTKAGYGGSVYGGVKR